MESQISKFDIIRDYKTRCPVDVFRLAETLGIQVKEIKLPSDISGRIRRIDSRFEIHVNAAHGMNRKRFTVAHEIAHYILHRDLFDSEIVDDEMYRSEQIHSALETKANAYAAELLMPEELLNKEFEKLTGVSGTGKIENLANLFQVSKEAMRIRLEVLGKN